MDNARPLIHDEIIEDDQAHGDEKDGPNDEEYVRWGNIEIELISNFISFHTKKIVHHHS